MKNAIKVICFVLAVLLAGASTFYFAFIWDMNEFVFIDGTEKGTVIITDYIGSDKDVKVPKTLRGKKVVGIDSHTFKGDDINSVEVGDNVKWIGDYAFSGCQNLTSVDLGKSVESLGEEVFANCTELTYCKFSPVLKSVGSLMFGNNDKITDIDLNGNSNFKVVDGVIYSSDMSVLYETLLSADLSSYSLPKTITELKPMAFYGQKEMKSIKLNSSIKTIPYACFGMCSGLTELVIPDSVESISGSILFGTSVKVVKIPKSVKVIDDKAFEHNEIPELDEEGNPVLDEFGKPVLKKEHEITIVTVKGSAAEKFANRPEHEYPLQIVDKF